MSQCRTYPEAIFTEMPMSPIGRIGPIFLTTRSPVPTLRLHWPVVSPKGSGPAPYQDSKPSAQCRPLGFGLGTWSRCSLHDHLTMFPLAQQCPAYRYFPKSRPRHVG